MSFHLWQPPYEAYFSFQSSVLPFRLPGVNTKIHQLITQEEVGYSLGESSSSVKLKK